MCHIVYFSEVYINEKESLKTAHWVMKRFVILKPTLCKSLHCKQVLFGYSLHFRSVCNLDCSYYNNLLCCTQFLIYLPIRYNTRLNRIHLVNWKVDLFFFMFEISVLCMKSLILTLPFVNDIRVLHVVGVEKSLIATDIFVTPVTSIFSDAVSRTWWKTFIYICQVLQFDVCRNH